jgi:hypothetical protein
MELHAVVQHGSLSQNTSQFEIFELSATLFVALNRLMMAPHLAPKNGVNGSSNGTVKPGWTPVQPRMQVPVRCRAPESAAGAVMLPLSAGPVVGAPGIVYRNPGDQILTITCQAFTSQH